MTEVNILKKSEPKRVILSDGNEYIFPPIDLNTFANLEDVLGYSLEELPEKVKDKRMTTMRALVYALLKQNHPDMTLEKAGSLVTIDEMKEVTNIIIAIVG